MYLEAAQALIAARKPIALTGAGASVESGIPDFRSPGGIWDAYPPEEFATIQAFLANPDKVWGMWHELGRMLQGVAPNPGHTALAELARLERLHAIITQNIDNLHQVAGSPSVIEYHGNAARMRCLRCETPQPLEFQAGAAGAPRCDCGGVMKPDVVLFGELIPPHAMTESEALTAACDLVLIVGTSATVYPAADLPFAAKANGATIIECNLEHTEFTGSITDIFLEGPAGTVLPQLVSAVRSCCGAV